MELLAAGIVRSIAQAIYYPLYRTGVRVKCFGHRITDAAFRNERLFPLPPPELRFRVAGDPGADRFVRVGAETVDNLNACLASVGYSLDSFEAILDFGAGCGRTLIPISRRLPRARLYAVDTDHDAIEWCQRNLSTVESRSNAAQPPLPFDDGYFDLIYAVSVFTHLGPAMEQQWLAELKRVLRPGGIAVLTVYSAATIESCAAETMREVEERGIVLKESRKLEGFFPLWYQTSFRSKAYTRQVFGQYLPILEYLPRGMGDLDAVICRK